MVAKMGRTEKKHKAGYCAHWVASRGGYPAVQGP